MAWSMSDGFEMCDLTEEPNDSDMSISPTIRVSSALKDRRQKRGVGETSNVRKPVSFLGTTSHMSNF